MSERRDCLQRSIRSAGWRPFMTLSRMAVRAASSSLSGTAEKTREWDFHDQETWRVPRGGDVGLRPWGKWRNECLPLVFIGYGPFKRKEIAKPRRNNILPWWSKVFGMYALWPFTWLARAMLKALCMRKTAEIQPSTVFDLTLHEFKLWPQLLSVTSTWPCVPSANVGFRRVVNVKHHTSHL